jgi:tetratricopeptide (TPR) repeat protein
MIRAAALVIALGALVSASILHASRVVGPQLSDPGAKPSADLNDWPICASPVFAEANADWARLDPDFATGKKALAAQDWDAAIAALSSAALRDPRNADIHVYLGLAHRNAGKLEPAFRHYQLALQLNPRQRDAHEHAGKARLVVADLANAEAHLAALKEICLLPCAQHADLRGAVERFKTRIPEGRRPSWP